MAIAAGTKLGPYEILSPLGAGGMGEVYRARDTRLDRTVAIKVLPDHLSSNPEVRQRFEREARAISNLSHPHICTLHDIGHQDGIDYLVMEFIEGESLADRLVKGALPTEQVLRYAIQLADALDKAHRAGIVHRDLKPGNIMLTKAGVKLLDFGLAKQLGSDPAIASSLTSLPTERHAITGEGAILGTFQYMAPEQLEGKEADSRTDIFAFGAVVYEMATSKKAFTGKSQASLISSIMTSEPPAITSLQPMTPPALDRVVKKCLAKDPDERWQSAHDLMSELKWIAEGVLQAEATAPFVARRKSRERLAWIAAAVFLLGLLASLPFTIAHLRRAAVETQTTRFFVSPPEKSTLGDVTVSPDGRRLAFIATDAAGKTLLWVRPLDALAAQPLAGSDDASYPFWSPDSRFIGFFAGRKLKKVEVTGGPPSTLCNAPDARGGAWNLDDVIIFAPHASSGLSRVSASGDEPLPVTTLDSSRQEDSHRFPQFLPDGRHFLYFARSSQLENSAIYVSSLDHPQTKRIMSANTNAAYASPGYLLFQRERTLMAQAFDAASLELTGTPFRVAEQVGYSRETKNAYFSVSDTGVLVYRSGGTSKTQLVWVDRSGKQLGSPGPPGEYRFPALSPDEKRVAIARSDAQTGNGDIWLLDLARGIASRFTFDPALEIYPIWSPDGSRIVFASDRDGVLNLYQKLSSGTGSEEALLKSSDDKILTDWSLDGRFILYDQITPISPKTQWDLWALPLLGDRQPIPFLQTRFSEEAGVFSPDARWIAYQSDESGSYQVYVQSFPPSGGKWQISSEGGSWPRFRRDGKELFYLAANGKLMAVEVKANASGFEFSVPKPLFETHTTDRYAVTADGQRFLMNTPVEESASAPITVVLNWAAELKR